MTDTPIAGPRAACVIVQRGPRILAFIREKDGQVGLPCGWREPGEDLPLTAVRECREETGLAVKLTDEEPFVGFDPRGGNVVAAYRGVIESEGGATHPFEGTPVWVGVRELLASGYGDFNRRALRHFGILRPIAGKFHSHLTLRCTEREAERARALVSGKVTIIELERAGRQQVDVMLTHHFVVGNRGLDDHIDVLNSLRAKAQMLRDSGIEVIRVKLEHELLDPLSDATDRQTSMDISSYIEAHIKCKVNLSDLSPLKAEAATRDWHPSRNPLQQVDGVATQFINRRFYEQQDLMSVEAETDAMVACLSRWCQIVEVKLETAIYDSNDDLDRWWMTAESSAAHQERTP